MKNPVTALRLPLRPGREYESRFDREQSSLKMLAIPIASVVLSSMVTTLPFLVTQPLLPPLGFMMMLAWRLMRPGLLPMWAGLPFGLTDDLFSGQPFGSAGLIWSLAMLVIELIDTRVAWRDHAQDWFVASALIVLALLGGLWISGLAHARPDATVLVPQIILSILLYPLVVRICSRLDSWRLAT
ncbi:MAG: rod shape-determining protein MreD [Sphingorhabdus sp.]